MVSPSVGVLALQGAVREHIAAFARCDVVAREVRSVRELDGLTHLVIPGGESTTLWRLLERFELWEEIPRRWRAGELVLFGTCAGAILMGRAKAGEEERPPRWGLLDVEVERNAYGGQLESEVREVELTETGEKINVPFIRAPRFGGGCTESHHFHPHSHLRTLAVASDLPANAGESGATPYNHPVLVAGPGALAATFHPELTDVDAVHRLFLAYSARNQEELRCT